MTQLTGEHATEFFRRSYTAVDGLWFMRTEAQYGFDAALDLDAEVWAVMPKIQARMLQEMTGQREGLASLETCFTTKLRWEGFTFQSRLDESNGLLEITIEECLWLKLMLKAGRAHLAAKIGSRICAGEYAAWAAEFGPDITSEVPHNMCQGAAACLLRFKR